MAKLCHGHRWSTAHHQKVMTPHRSALLRPPWSAVSAFGIPPRHRCTEQVRSRAAGWLGAGAHGMEELGFFTFQNKAGWEGWPSTTACLEVCREERDRCFLEARGDRTRGKGCELEEGKIRSGIRKTCSQWLVTGMACAETLWDFHRWRWSKPTWT